MRGDVRLQLTLLTLQSRMAYCFTVFIQRLYIFVCWRCYMLVYYNRREPFVRIFSHFLVDTLAGIDVEFN